MGNNSVVFVYKWNRFQAPELSFRAMVGAVLYKISGGLIETKATARYRAARSNAWARHAAMIQSLLDEERAKGYGFSVLTGRRVDFE